MVLRMKNFNILEVHWKIQLFGGGSLRKTNIEQGLGQFADLRGVWQERVGGILEEVDTTMHTMSYPKIIWHMS